MSDIRSSDDYVRLEEAKRIYKKIATEIFTEGENISMNAFGGKWTGYPSEPKIVQFLAYMRRTELVNDHLHFSKLYISLENIVNKLIKDGVSKVESFKSTIETIKSVEDELLNLKFPMGYIVNGKKQDIDKIIQNQLYGDFFHSDIGKIKAKRESLAAEDISIFHTANKYKGHYMQLENIVNTFDGLLPYIKSKTHQ